VNCEIWKSIQFKKRSKIIKGDRKGFGFRGITNTILTLATSILLGATHVAGKPKTKSYAWESVEKGLNIGHVLLCN